MKYVGVLCVIAMVVVAVLLILRLKKLDDEATNSKEKSASPNVKDNCEIVKNNVTNDLGIKIEQLSIDEFDCNDSNLIEIKDSKVLEHINNLVPSLAQVGNNLNNATQAIKAANEGTLYRAIIPKDAVLAESKAMDGAFRGIYHGTDGIKGHANLESVKTQTESAVIANTAAAAMNVASIVVGQYYMTQINAELDVICDGISQIQNFQDNEYRSRVFSLIIQVKKIADFQLEILKNNELRISKINQLDSLEEECTQLLGQANLTLTDFTKKTNLDYDMYEKDVEKANNWFVYQKLLLDILYQISDLRYALHLGVVSREQCNAILPMYTKQVNDTQYMLTAWHGTVVERLKIDTDEDRRKRTGVERAVYFLPGLFNDDLNYRSIKKSTSNMICTQASGETQMLIDKSELYSKDVQLIVKEGKIYYLPESNNK